MADVATPPTAAPDGHTVVSHEVGGRVLSGVNADPAALAKTMERHQPPSPEKPADSDTPKASPPRNDQGQFAGPRENKGRARVQQALHEKDAAQQAAAAAKTDSSEVASLKSELAALRQEWQSAQQARQPAPAAQPPVAPQAPPPTRPRPQEAEIGAKYPTYADFSADLARWVYEQQNTAPLIQQQVWQALQMHAAASQLQQRATEVLTEGQQTYSDFQEVMQRGPGSQTVLPMDRLQAILRHPQSATVQYAIARDAQLAHYLAHCDPISFGATLMQIAPQARAAVPATTPPAGGSTAPAPYQPVGPGSKTTSPSSAELASKGYDFDASGYREKRAAERGVKRRY